MAEPAAVLFSRYGPGQALQQTIRLRSMSGTRQRLRHGVARARSVTLCPVVAHAWRECRESFLGVQRPMSAWGTALCFTEH